MKGSKNMSWVNLDDVYVNKTGDSIAGNLSVGGTLTINNAKGNDGTYNVANEITTLRDSVSQYTTKSFTSAAKSLKYGAVADFDTSVKYDGYTPVCLTTVKSNHAGSCIITQFGLRDDGTAYASIQNNEVTNKGTWSDLEITFVILYKKNII